ncbi:GntR family transcriptional regulator [Actinomadura logoneensis]|uniref:GntR family transcriptional regulator n=1 Tax=Actinomadura logoneensis TaxID=2293572 RepID=A0A372JNF1_9ACTN|nr:GntR family transcriptional regulator [Actinomadura logoneensis]RFU41547.1 GntR family transcriptional regulator [Actinomadura logoneensis]
MSPQINRSDPPYKQIADHIEHRIASGDLRDGDLVPSSRQLMKDWGVSMATATKAHAALRSRGLAEGRPGVGTVVTSVAAVCGAQHRILAVRGTGKIYPPNEHARIKEASLTQAPEHVADALGLEAGASVIRRARVTYRDDSPVSASVSWMSGALADQAPLLLSTERLQQGTLGYIKEITGRSAAGRQKEQVTADAANAEDVEDLGVEPGTPLLRARVWIRDGAGDVIEYGEYAAVPGRWMTFEYEIAE